MSQPPTVGPTIGDTITPRPQMAMAIPRWRGGKISMRIAWESGMRGPPPRPWRSRAPTRNSRLGATPDRRELAMKTVVESRKKRRRPRRATSQPVAGRITPFAARNDVRTHVISSSEAERVPCMCGRATLVTLVSRTCIDATSMTAVVTSHRRPALSAVIPFAARAIGYRTSMVTVADMPVRRRWGLAWYSSSTILTGTRWTTLTQLPEAFSGGKRLKRAPVPALIESTRPRKTRSGKVSTRTVAT